MFGISSWNKLHVERHRIVLKFTKLCWYTSRTYGDMEKILNDTQLPIFLNFFRNCIPQAITSFVVGVTPRNHMSVREKSVILQFIKFCWCNSRIMRDMGEIYTNLRVLPRWLYFSHLCSRGRNFTKNGNIPLK